jgi:hypothetical protein
MPKAIVVLAFPYLVSFVRARCRNAESAYFRATVPVAIEAVSSAEAPIVCVVDSNPGRKDHELYLKEVRRFGGRFFLADTNDEGIPCVDLKLLQSAASNSGADWDSSPFHRLGKRVGETQLREPVRKLPEARDVAIREVLHSCREEVELSIKQEVSEYLMVDGILHRCVPEPRLLVEYRHHGLEFDVVFHDEYPRSRWVSAVFGIHEETKVTEFVRRLVESDDVNVDYVQERERIDRVDPSVPWSDFAADSLSICAPGIMKQARKAAPWLPRAGIEAFIAMKDAYQAFVAGDRDRNTVARFCSAYADMASECTDDNLRRVDDDPETLRGHNDAHDLARMSDRWLVRFRIDSLAPESQLPKEIEAALAGLDG